MTQDLRFAIRTLLRSRAFAAASVCTLALAIGANTIMFSVLNTVLLQPLRYHAPGQLAMLWTEDPTQNLREGRSALWNVGQWRSQSRSFADIAVFDAMSITLTGADGAEQIVGAGISPNLFPLLGVQPARGRGFSPEEVERQEPVVLLSHRFWQSRFGGSNDAIGATIVLNGVPSQIIGILPDGFQVATLAADVWQPQAMADEGDPRRGLNGGDTWFAIGRLRPQVTLERAQEEMTAIARRVNAQLPAAERNRGVSLVSLDLYMVGSQSRLAMWMLSGAVFGLLLIAAANVASLSLARSVGRTREIALRAALGASSGRIVRQLLTESVLLAIVSGLIGTLLALAGIRALRTYGPANVPRLDEVNLDLRVLGWALGISLLAGVLVGLAPAIKTLGRDVRASGTRRALVVAEFALAIVLLVGAGLLLRSWEHVRSIDPGFRSERVLMMEVSAPTTFGTPAERSDLYDRVLEQIRAVPGVESAGIIGDLFIGNSREQVLTIEGDEGIVSGRVRFRRDETSADFFRTLGTPLLRGRVFSIADGPDAPRVAIVNEAMARRSWPARDPIGRRFKFGPADAEGAWFTVIGVAADMRRQGQEREPVPQIFESLAQNTPRSVDIFVRTATEHPLAMAGAVQTAVRRAEKSAPIYGLALLDDRLGTYLAERRFQASLLTAFSLVALLMAAVGIYGVLNYSIASRTQEIGVRMAIGARALDIFRMIIGEGLTLSLTGLALGLVGAWWLGQFASSLLFGVTAHDPWTFATVALLLTAVATAACYFPARRAMAVDPLVALRVTPD